MKYMLSMLGLSLLSGITQATSIIPSFDSHVLDDWKWLHDSDGWPNQLAKQEIKAGNLILEPYTSTWTGAFHAPFLYQTVSGDFVATTRVKVEGLTGADFRWQNIGSKAGFLVRKPTKPANGWKPEDENYLLFVTGDATYCVPCFDFVAVQNGKTRALINHGVYGWVNLRLVRIGNTFIAMYQLPKGPWTVMQLDSNKLALDYRGFDMDLIQRDDMPATVQIGLTAMADSPTLDSPRWRRMDEDPKLSSEFNHTVIKNGAKRDARALFSEVSIRPFIAPKAWKGKNLNTIKEADLVRELGKDR